MRSAGLAGSLAAIVALAGCAVGPAGGQEPETGAKRPQEPGRPAADEAAGRDDGRSVESLVAALYDVLSGPKGRARDWDRFKALFCDGAVLATVQRDREGKLRRVRLTPAGYVERSGAFVEREGMFEREVAHRRLEYGAVAVAWSTYELRLGSPDGPPKVRGINAIQCFREADGWRVQAVVWDAEPTAGPIPDRFLLREAAPPVRGGGR
ncbi:MAG: nuclear transport factor 2 family protein [Planctomycetota bacterium]